MKKKTKGGKGVCLLLALTTKVNAHPNGSVFATAKDYDTGKKAR